jgi:NMD protein affecting ribosome stability and mRNA decay
MSGKALIRSMNRRGAAAKKSVPGEPVRRTPAEPTLCERCGAVFARRTWRLDHHTPKATLAHARWRVCPACAQTAAAEWCGRVLLSGTFVAAHEDDIRRRVANVAERARARQPERRIVSIEAYDGGLEILTTSQKLAHRVAHELEKAFRGRASYRWSDDRTLQATWQRDLPRGAARA